MTYLSRVLPLPGVSIQKLQVLYFMTMVARRFVLRVPLIDACVLTAAERHTLSLIYRLRRCLRQRYCDVRQ